MLVLATLVPPSTARSLVHSTGLSRRRLAVLRLRRQQGTQCVTTAAAR